MTSTLLAILAISGIAAGLATVLVFADRYISNYGECEITINRDDKITVQGGASLLESLSSEKIFIPSACGGRGTCAYCKVKVTEGAGPLMPTEEPYLDEEERAQSVRLSCQVKVRNALSVEIPEELLSIQEYKCVVEEIEELTYDIKRFRFKLIEPDTMDFIPGQYVQVLTPAYKGSPEEVYRAYSIGSDPADKGYIELIVRLVPNGICTTYLFDHVKEGDSAIINGPYGDFMLSGTDTPILYIAGGSGMAPIRCMLYHMANNGITRPATYFFGVNEMRDLFMDKEMKELEGKVPEYKFVPVMARPDADSGWTGQTGLVTEALERNVEDASKCEAYLCGSPGMIDASIDVLTRLGMPEEHIYFDKFS